MESKKVVSSITWTCIKIAVYILVLIAVIAIGNTSYKFGYAVFADRVYEEEPGTDMTVTIREGTSVYNVGKLLERRGLIKDAKVFVVQEMLSAYHGEITPGSYVLNSSYDVEQILEILADRPDEEEDDSYQAPVQTEAPEDSGDEENDEEGREDDQPDDGMIEE